MKYFLYIFPLLRLLRTCKQPSYAVCLSLHVFLIKLVSTTVFVIFSNLRQSTCFLRSHWSKSVIYILISTPSLNGLLFIPVYLNAASTHLGHPLLFLSMCGSPYLGAKLVPNLHSTQVLPRMCTCLALYLFIFFHKYASDVTAVDLASHNAFQLGQQKQWQGGCTSKYGSSSVYSRSFQVCEKRLTSQSVLGKHTNCLLY